MIKPSAEVCTTPLSTHSLDGSFRPQIHLGPLGLPIDSKDHIWLLANTHAFAQHTTICDRNGMFRRSFQYDLSGTSKRPIPQDTDGTETFISDHAWHEFDRKLTATYPDSTTSIRSYDDSSYSAGDEQQGRDLTQFEAGDENPFKDVANEVVYRVDRNELASNGRENQTVFIPGEDVEIVSGVSGEEDKGELGIQFSLVFNHDDITIDHVRLSGRTEGVVYPNTDSTLATLEVRASQPLATIVNKQKINHEEGGQLRWLVDVEVSATVTSTSWEIIEKPNGANNRNNPTRRRLNAAVTNPTTRDTFRTEMPIGINLSPLVNSRGDSDGNGNRFSGTSVLTLY